MPTSTHAGDEEPIKGFADKQAAPNESAQEWPGGAGRAPLLQRPLLGSPSRRLQRGGEAASAEQETGCEKHPFQGQQGTQSVLSAVGGPDSPADIILML